MSDNQTDQPTLYFEDFTPGRVWESHERAMGEDEIVGFATNFDPQYLHVDPDAAAKSIYGGLIASGWHTASVCMRLIVDTYLYRAASLGSPGVDELRWVKPVRAGDIIKVRTTVLEQIPSKSKPDRGLVRNQWEAINQNGETVMTMKGLGMFKRRTPGG